MTTTSVQQPVLVRDLMKPGVRVRFDQPLGEVAMAMLQHRLDTVPVCDRQGRPLGVVTCQAVTSGRPAGRVSHVPVSPAPSIDAGSDLTEAAQVMLGQRFDSLPVLDGGEVVGALTRADIVSAFWD